jgi:hypothetical protein
MIYLTFKVYLHDGPYFLNGNSLSIVSKSSQMSILDESVGLIVSGKRLKHI